MAQTLWLFSPYPNLKILFEDLPKTTVEENLSKEEDVIASLKKEEGPSVLFYLCPILKETSDENFLIRFHYRFPNTRILYVSPQIEIRSPSVNQQLSTFLYMGLYDIYEEKKLTKEKIETMLNNCMSYQDAEIYLDDLRKQKVNAEEENPYIEGSLSPGYDNIIAVTSIKPGSGKSFVAINLAAAIAKYGKKKKNEKRPKIALIEGNFQTLSINTLLQDGESDFDLINALKAVATILDEDGNVNASQEQIKKVKTFIMKSFVSYQSIPNLYILSPILFEGETYAELNHINPYHYFYMIESIVDEFDVIFIDSNSSLEHMTTGPILQLANICLYVIDLEYNNIKMNLRNKALLEQLGLQNKVRYILNRNQVEESSSKVEFEEEVLKKEFHMIGKIPTIDDVIVYNHTKQGIPVILDKKTDTLIARMEITSIADKIWDMDNIKALKIEKEIFLHDGLEKDKPDLWDEWTRKR